MQAVVRFVDDGRTDDKWICGDQPPRAAERALVIGFFRVYARLKAAVQWARGGAGDTRYLGWETVHP